MLNRIILLSLQNRKLVALLAFVVAAVGTMIGMRLPVDVLPDLNRPTVQIMTDAHGMVPEDVEMLVTQHVERAVNGASGVQRVRSSSGVGLSMVAVEFGWGIDIYRARQIVQEKIQLVLPLLPPGVQPFMTPISSIMGQVQHIGLYSKSGETETSELRTLADQVLKPRIVAVPGVAQVVSNGSARRELQVIVDTQKMRAVDVSLAAVERAMSASNLSGSGGYFRTGSQGLLINVTGLVKTPSDLGKAVVRDDPVRPILIEDVAEVRFGPAAVRTGDAGVNAKPGVILVVMKQPGVDTVALTEAVDAEIASVRASLSEDIVILPGIYRQADFINRAIDNVIEALLDGTILVVLVLFVFLFNLRTTVITLTAIPLSIGVTAIIFEWMGVSINTMTLGGLAVAIGALVDDAIVDVENVFRRLRESREQGTSALKVVYKASCEVRRPILVGTLVVTAVYVPLFALTGMEGRLFTPIGLTYIISLLASLLVSLTVTPVLCLFLLPTSKAVFSGKEPRAAKSLKTLAGPIIDFSMRHPARIIAVVAALLLAGGVALNGRGTRFLPPFNEGAAQVNLILPPGTSLEQSDELGRALEELVMATPGVTMLGRRTGRGEGDEHAEGVNVSELVVTFDPESERARDEMLADIRARIAKRFPGFSTSTEQPLAHLISHMLSGVYAQVSIKVEGEDLVILRRFATEVKAAIAGVPGVADLMVEQLGLVEQVEIKPRRSAMARFGMNVADVKETIELALEGEEVSRLSTGMFTFPIVLRLREEDRKNLDSLRSLPMESPSGRRLKLGDIADVRTGWTSHGIKRENATRRIVVQHNVQGRALSDVVADVERRIEPIRKRLPAGYAMRISGQFEAQVRAARVVTWLSLLSIAVMGGLLMWHFKSLNLTLQTLSNIPVAFLGGAAAILITGQDISIASLVGFISLGGIAARNKILLIDHYLHLVLEEGETFSQAMIRRAGQERIVPVLMTALTSGIALLPLVLTPGEPGRELLYPVASIIVGGLVATTLMDLLLTPGVFWVFGRRAVDRALERGTMTSPTME